MSLKDVKNSNEQELKNSLHEAPEAGFTPSFFSAKTAVFLTSNEFNNCCVLPGCLQRTFPDRRPHFSTPICVLADRKGQLLHCHRDTLELLELFQFGKILTERKHEESHADNF